MNGVGLRWVLRNPKVELVLVQVVIEARLMEAEQVIGEVDLLLQSELQTWEEMEPISVIVVGELQE